MCRSPLRVILGRPLIARYLLADTADGRLAVMEMAEASGLWNFTRITSGAFAVSIATTFWERDATIHQARLAEVTSVYDPRLQHAVDALGARGLGELQSLGVLTHEMTGQAYLLSALDFFWICGWLSFAMIALVWFTRRAQGAAHAPVE